MNVHTKYGQDVAEEICTREKNDWENKQQAILEKHARESSTMADDQHAELSNTQDIEKVI